MAKPKRYSSRKLTPKSAQQDSRRSRALDENAQTGATRKTARQKPSAKAKAQPPVEWKFPLSKRNLFVAGLGLAIILIGFALMSTGITEEPAVPDGKWNNPLAVAVAPFMLVIGYCVVIPYAIMKLMPDKNKEDVVS